MTSVSPTAGVNPFYGANQASGVKPTDVAKAASKAATQEAAGLGESPVAKKDVTQDFLDYAKLSIPERIRKNFLEQEGLTEESLAAMAEEERKKIEDQIKEAIEAAVKKEIGEKVGGVANLLV